MTSFEAVPCMFKQRQEDGAEVGMFGLLIRPSSSTTTNGAADGGGGGQNNGGGGDGGKQHSSSPPSTSSTCADHHPPQITAAATLSSGAIQIGGDPKREVVIGTKGVVPRPPAAFLGHHPQMVQLKAAAHSAGGGPFALLAPPGMPPLLPKPKRGAQKPGTMPIIVPKTGGTMAAAATRVIVPITPMPPKGGIIDISAQSPSQVVPQQIDMLNIATTSSASSSSSSVSPGSNNSSPQQSGGGLLAIQKLPSPGKAGGGQKHQKKGTTAAKEGAQKRVVEKGGGSKRRRQQRQEERLAEEKPEEKGTGTTMDHPPHNHPPQDGETLDGDLHSINLSELINSTVITTEDYLISQNEPIYSNLDMYNPGPGPSTSSASGHHPTAHSHHLPHHFTDPTTIPVSAGHQPQQLCPSAIYLHNQQHFPSTSSATSAARFLGPIQNGGQQLSHHQSTTQSQYAPQSQSAPHQSAPPPPVGWHPYLLAHPGGSHISSTPDSGIQSIDGSPPSVYTPPMVSPYASQVRSCESVCANGHGGNGMMMGANGVVPMSMPSSSSAPSYPPSSSSYHGGMCQGESNLLLMSTTAPSTMAAMCQQQQMASTAPPRLIGHHRYSMPTANQQEECRQMMEEGRGEGGDAEEEDDGQEEDFSDMPKLLPMHMYHHQQHAEEEEEAMEGDEREQPSTSSSTLAGQREDECQKQRAPVPSKQQQQENGTTTPMPTPTKGGGGADVFFHPGMSLQQLAECISSSMPPEQLKQLTSLIQSKAAATSAASNLTTTATTAQVPTGKKAAATAEPKQRRRSSKGTTTRIMAIGQEGPTTTTKEPTTSAAAEQRQKEAAAAERKKLKKKQKREAEKMAVTSWQPELKEKSEKLANAKGGGQLSTTSSRKQPPMVDGKEDGKTDEWEKRRREERLAAYRLKVAAQLSRKLEAFTARVCQQLDGTHLGIRDECWPSGRPFPLRQLNWEEVEKRGPATKWQRMIGSGGREEDEKRMMMKRGRKKRRRRKEDEEKKGKEERKKHGKRKEEDEEERNGKKKDEDEEEGMKRNGKRKEEDEDEKKAGGRKRKRMEEEDREMAKKRRRRTSRSKEGAEEEKEDEEEEPKQRTPPIILKLPNLLKNARRPKAEGVKRGKDKKSRPNHATAFSAVLPSPCRILVKDIRAGKTAQRHQRQQLTPSPNCGILTTAAHRPTLPSSPAPTPLSPDQLASVRAGHWFLPRNLRARNKGRGGEGKEEAAAPAPWIDLAQLLRQIFDKFLAISQRNPGMAKRHHCGHLRRAIRMLLSPINFGQAHHPSPALLLDRFDGLLKQFISSVASSPKVDQQMRGEYLQLKRAVDFGRVQPQLQKELLQMFTEDRRRTLHHHPNQPSSASSAIALPSKKGAISVADSSSTSSAVATSTTNLPRVGALTVDTTLDLSYMDSPHPVGAGWDPDREAKLSPNSDNRDHDCVRCICGMAEDDGVMTQCDRCHFWLHADCLDQPVQEDQEYICDLCTRRLDTTPRVDIVLRPQPSIKFSGCAYYRTLVNSRRLQIRLNEAVYVERLINDRHKKILRELHEECVRKQQPQPSPSQSPVKPGGRRDTSAGTKGGRRKNGDKMMEKPKWDAPGKAEEDGGRVPNRWWPEGEEEAERGAEFHRRDLRVFRVERLFISPNGERFIFGCYYARPHETFCDSSRMFYRNELFWTPLFDTLPLDSVVGRCLILEPQIWAMGRPNSPRYREDDVYVCEYQIDRNQRSFEKIAPKNRYYINTEPYVFNQFAERLRMKRDFTPFQVANEPEAGNKGAAENGTSIATIAESTAAQTSSASAIQRRLFQQHLERVCARIVAQQNSGNQRGEK